MRGSGKDDGHPTGPIQNTEAPGECCGWPQRWRAGHSLRAIFGCAQAGRASRLTERRTDGVPSLLDTGRTGRKK